MATLLADIPHLSSVLAWLGPLMWAGIAYAVVMGRRRMVRLRKRPEMRAGGGGGSSGEMKPVLPRVTVLVPVKDEAGNIERCARGLLEQDHPSFDVLIVDDRSTDGTAEILDRLASEFPRRLRVMHLSHLPSGWLGKPHALHAAVTAHWETLGEWLLLVDSDVVCEPAALREVATVAAEREYAMVSLVIGLIAPTLIERLVAPLAGAVWAATFRISDTNDDNRPGSAAANGQFLLIKRDVLRAVGGHAAVRDKTCEDVELARLVKATGRAVRFFLGQHLARTRMHATYRQMLNGWARNFAGTARHRPARLVLALIVLWSGALGAFLLPLAAFLGWWSVAGAAATQVVLIVGLLTLIYREAVRLPMRGALGLALLFPATVLLVTPLLLNGIRACYGGTVRWRGALVRA